MGKEQSASAKLESAADNFTRENGCFAVRTSTYNFVGDQAITTVKKKDAKLLRP